MGRQRFTLADLLARLNERLGTNEKFWPARQERKDALNEAISVWQALTGEWTTQMSISGKTPHRNFYKVPRQIVSLTRVGLLDYNNESASSGGLRVHIVANSEMQTHLIWGEPSWTYYVYPAQTIEWDAVPSGGQEPYSYSWTFSQDDGLLPVVTVQSTNNDEVPVLAIPDTADGPWTATLVTTDGAGDTYTSTFPFKVYGPDTTPRLGRMVLTSFISNALIDVSVGGPGYDGPTVGTTTFQADSDRAVQGIIQWMTGKVTGANILIVNNFWMQSQFFAGLTRLGHTYTMTGVANKFNGYDPFAYDMVIAHSALDTGESWNGYVLPEEKWNYFLSHNGKLWGIDGSTGVLANWGFPNGAAHAGDFVNQHSPLVGYGPTNWRNQAPWESSRLGLLPLGGSWNTDKYAMTLGAGSTMSLGASAHGGTGEVINCACTGHTVAQGIVGIWWADGDTGL